MKTCHNTCVAVSCLAATLLTAVSTAGITLPVAEVSERLHRDVSVFPGRVVPVAQVDVVPSPHFLGWIIALGGVRVTGPESVVAQMRDMAGRLAEQYP